MAIIKKQAYQCDRCKHEWYPRLQVDEIPAMCPKCKSAYWNKPRRRDLHSEQIRESLRLKKSRGRR